LTVFCYLSQLKIKDAAMFYGQEMNQTTYNLAQMNIILHGVHYRQLDIKQENTLEYPQHIEQLPFEAIDHSIKETDKSIADFCKELNISTPF
jgi:type I restriction-modification system DNA methylase subunit